jgi:hypothetical protein
MQGKRFGHDELIEALKRLAELLGRTPRARDADADHDVPCHSPYVTRFGSWRKALEAAGIPLDARNTGYDCEMLVDHLWELAETLGRTPRLADLEATDGPCGTTYQSHFAGWSEALVEARLEVDRRSRRYNREELLDVLRVFADELGHAPTTVELAQREDLPSAWAYRADSAGGTTR